MIYAFGDSFTAGLGVDNKWEQSQLGGRPDWNIMSEEKKDIQRNIVEKFRNKNPYATRFANKINQQCRILAQSGCSNIDILDTLVEFSYQIKQDDLVLIGFTSSLRDNIPYFPTKMNRGIAPNNNVLEWLNHIHVDNEIFGVDFRKFFQDYSSFYLTEMYDEKYYQIFNHNIIVFLQKFLEYKKVKYIMLDAFDNMLDKKLKNVNTKYYWNFGKETIYSYITSFNDEGLLETPGYNSYNQAPRHPSIEGHKLFAEELHKFYKKVHNG